jgi:hypothetical protein
MPTWSACLLSECPEILHRGILNPFHGPRICSICVELFDGYLNEVERWQS